MPDQILKTDHDSGVFNPVVEFKNIGKTFGSFVALNGLDLEIGEGEFFALLGPSGCGKTTLLRMLAGLEQPTTGAIYIDGKSIEGTPAYQMPTNMMFQSYALFPHLTVSGNIAFGLKQDKLPKDEIASRVRGMLALVRLEAFANRKPHQLSGGQRARVALARALIKRPRVLLLDEPLSALDRKLRETMQLELADIQKKVGMTFVIVTHDREEAMIVSSRIAVMRDGMIAQVAKPNEIYEYPRSRFVAEFVGDINVFPCEPSGEPMNGMQEVIADIGARKLRFSASCSPYDISGPLCCGVRPEKMCLELINDSSVEGVGLCEGRVCNYIAGEVVDIAYLGDLSIYHVDAGGGVQVRVSLINSGRAARAIKRGDRVIMDWYAEDSLLMEKS